MGEGVDGYDALRDALFADLGRSRQEELPLSNRERKGASFAPNRHMRGGKVHVNQVNAAFNAWKNTKIDDDESAQMKGLELGECPWRPSKPTTSNQYQFGNVTAKQAYIQPVKRVLQDNTAGLPIIQKRPVEKPAIKQAQSPAVTRSASSEPPAPVPQKADAAKEGPGAQKPKLEAQPSSAPSLPLDKCIFNSSKPDESNTGISICYYGYCINHPPGSEDKPFLVEFKFGIQPSGPRALLKLTAKGRGERTYHVLDLTPPTFVNQCCVLREKSHSKEAYCFQLRDDQSTELFSDCLSGLQRWVKEARDDTATPETDESQAHNTKEAVVKEADKISKEKGTAADKKPSEPSTPIPKADEPKAHIPQEHGVRDVNNISEKKGATKDKKPSDVPTSTKGTSVRAQPKASSTPKVVISQVPSSNGATALSNIENVPLTTNKTRHSSDDIAAASSDSQALRNKAHLKVPDKINSKDLINVGDDALGRGPRESKKDYEVWAEQAFDGLWNLSGRLASKVLSGDGSQKIPVYTTVEKALNAKWNSFQVPPGNEAVKGALLANMHSLILLQEEIFKRPVQTSQQPADNEIPESMKEFLKPIRYQPKELENLRPKSSECPQDIKNAEFLPPVQGVQKNKKQDLDSGSKNSYANIKTPSPSSLERLWSVPPMDVRSPTPGGNPTATETTGTRNAPSRRNTNETLISTVTTPKKPKAGLASSMFAR